MIPENDPLYPAFQLEFLALTRRLDRATIVVSPLDAWAALSQLQLASRHPANTGPTAAIAERGWNAASDVSAGPHPIEVQAIKVVKAWEHLGRCEEEFGPDARDACSEDRDALDGAILALRMLLRLAGHLEVPPEERFDGGV
jgi:hypothetical protein